MVTLILWSHAVYDQCLDFLFAAVKVGLAEAGIAFTDSEPFRGDDEYGDGQRHDVHQKVDRTHRTDSASLNLLCHHLFEPAESAAAALASQIPVTEFIPASRVHYELVDDEWSESFVEFKDAEIEIYDIADTLHKINGFIQWSIKILHDMLDLRSENVPEKFFLSPEIIMYESLIAANCLGDFCS